jgi:ribose transport system ATP-binding protein
VNETANGPHQTTRLRVSGLSKRYGSVQALDSVDFELRAGEIMALLGENGAGKSTLVKVLAGLVEPDSGTIEVNGEPVAVFPSGRSQAAGIAVVHQEYSSVPTMTVAENLVLGQSGVPPVWWPPALNRRANELLAQVGLDDIDPRTPVEQLAVAEMQLLEVARLLVRDAQILIFDEPTAALTDREIDRVLAVIRRLVEGGRSVIYVTHRLAEVFRLTDRVTVFRNGNSLPPGETAKLDVDAVINRMLGRELEAMFPPRDTLSDEPLFEVDGLLAPGLAAPVGFVLRRGEILGLTGQLGSGAGTTVRALAGQLPRTAGTVALEGDEVPARSSHQATVRQGLAYCTADRKRDGVFANRAIRENLSSPWLGTVANRAGWVSRRDERARATGIAERFAIDTRRLESPVAVLSGGNQQKVAVGKWLGTQPKVLLLEEPTRGVDVGARAEIYASLRRLCASGLGIIVVSSDMPEVLGLSDTIATFYRGRMTSIAPHDQRTEEELTREVMHHGSGEAVA